MTTLQKGYTLFSTLSSNLENEGKPKKREVKKFLEFVQESEPEKQEAIYLLIVEFWRLETPYRPKIIDPENPPKLPFETDESTIDSTSKVDSVDFEWNKIPTPLQIVLLKFAGIRKKS